MSSSGKEFARRYGAYTALGALFIALLGIAAGIASYSLGISVQGNLTDALNAVSSGNATAFAWSVFSAIIIGVIAIISFAAFPTIKRLFGTHDPTNAPKMKIKVWALMAMGFLIAIELWFIGMFLIATHTASGADAVSIWHALASGQLYSIIAVFIVVPIIALTIIKTAPKVYKATEEFEKKEHIPDLPDGK